MAGFAIENEFIAEQNTPRFENLQRDFDSLAEQLADRGVDAAKITGKAAAFRVAIPSWGVGTGGTRFARFPGRGEPRDIFEKLEDCATINDLIRITPNISLHIPWDRPDDAAELTSFAESRGLGFDAMNSNTFQDQPDQKLSYKFGSLTHTDAAVRRQAIDHNIECIEIGRALGSTALTVWIADGSSFPGQQHFRAALERYIDSMREIYAALPDDWWLYIEHKMYEPAFYSTVICDWGTSYWCATQLGDRALSLVDLGHHAPNTNIEMVVARLIQFGKLGGFHLNDSKYGDDDMDTGSINPYQLFLVFNELVDAERTIPDFAPCYMLDQSHNISDPIESLLVSAIEAQRAYVQANLVDRAALDEAQSSNDALRAAELLKEAYRTDVSAILAMARHREGGAVDPLATYRLSGYRDLKAKERPQETNPRSGIV